MKEQVLVTGVEGLIGHAVALEFLNAGYDVLGLDTNPSGDQIQSDSYRFVKADLVDCDFDRLMRPYNVGAIVHCAAHPGGKSLKEPLLDVQVNAVGSMKIFEWAALNNKEIIYLSSSAVYGQQPDVALSEDVETDPNTIYAICKVANERFLKTLQEGYGLKWTVLRLFATYGAGHKPNTFQGIVNILLTQLEQGDEVIVKGSLDRVRGLLYVKDAARAILAAYKSIAARGEVINISEEEPVTIRGIIDALAAVLGKDVSTLRIIEESGTVGDTFYNYADCSKMKSLLEFEPAYSLEEGLTELVNDRLESRL